MSTVITLDMMRQSLYSAAMCDALDAMGLRRQSPRVPLRPLTVARVLVGRCKTTLWANMFHEDPKPYELELIAVDSCRPDDVFIAAAGGSIHSGVWGELLSTAAKNRGCVGVIVDGAVRDVAAMRVMEFPAFARGTCVYDSKDRQRVIDMDVVVEIDGVPFHPGDLVIADEDGVVVAPRAAETEAVRRAWEKVHAENVVRDEIRAGAKGHRSVPQIRHLVSDSVAAARLAEGTTNPTNPTNNYNPFILYLFVGFVGFVVLSSRRRPITPLE